MVKTYRGQEAEGWRSSEQIPDVAPQGVGDGVDRGEGRVTNPTLQALKVLGRHAGAVRELLLGQAGACPGIP